MADQLFVSSHLPTLDESGLGLVEYNQVTRAVSELVEPSTSKKKRGKGSGSYTHYTPDQHFKIGEYARENGNERAFISIAELEGKHKKKLDEEKKKAIPQPVI